MTARTTATPGMPEDPNQGHTRRGTLAGRIRQQENCKQDGEDRKDGQDAEGPTPVQGGAQPGTERRPHCESHRGAKGRNGQCAPGMFGSGDAAGVTGEHAPQQAGECTGKKPRSQGKHDIRGERRDKVRGQEAKDPDHENRLPAHAPGHGDRGHRGHDGSQGVGADELPGGALGNVQPGGDLRQQAGRHGFCGDQQEPHQCHDQQGRPREPVYPGGRIRLCVFEGTEVFVGQAVRRCSAGVILKGCASQKWFRSSVGWDWRVEAQSFRLRVASKRPLRSRIAARSSNVPIRTIPVKCPTCS